MTIADRIGVSTISLVGISVEDAIARIKRAGFRAIEIFVGVPGSGAIGHPDPIPVAGAWPRAMDTAAQQHMRELLDGFMYVTLHAQIVDTNITSLNEGIREESVRQHLECFELAEAIGASVLTFHPSRPAQTRAHYTWAYQDKAVEFNLDFARLAAKRAADFNVVSGFEGPHGAGYPVVDMVVEMHDPRFGVLVDIAQGLNGYHWDHETMLVAIEKCRGMIPEVHVHGALHRSISVAAHLPLRMNNMVDYPRMLAKLHEVGFDGPFMFEITSSDDPDQVIRDCQDSKRILVDWHNESASNSS